MWKTLARCTVRPLRHLRRQPPRHASFCGCVYQGCAGGTCLMDRMRKPPPPMSFDWRQQPPIADVARHAQRATRATQVALPLQLEGVVIRVHGPHECTLLAPLAPDGHEEYTFRVTLNLPHSTPVDLYQTVRVVLTACAEGGGWKAVWVTPPTTPEA